MVLNQLDLMVYFFVIVALISQSSALDLRRARNVWNQLKPEEDNSVVTTQEEINFLKGLPFPRPTILGKEKELRRMLGKFDRRYLSNVKPTKTVVNSNRRKQLMASMPSNLKNLHFTVPGSERELGNRASKKLRLWLWNMATCRVEPQWVDHGPLIWPRFINVGRCSQKKACSFPEGMTCQPSKKKNLRTLIWFCNESLMPEKLNCMWHELASIQTIEKCECSC